VKSTLPVSLKTRLFQALFGGVPEQFAAPVSFVQHTNEAKNAWRKTKHVLGARQARRLVKAARRQILLDAQP
jgi:hypothetical protein